MGSMMFWGFALRFIQCLAQAAPFILTGFVIAAILERFFGTAGTRQLFGGTGRGSLFRAWLIGMLLPVCSLGVIPVVRVLRRAGVPGGTILAFAMSAPLFNPLSLLYGLTLSEPVAIVAFALCSLVIVTIVGITWDRMFPIQGGCSEESRPIAYGIRRMAAVGTSAARHASGDSWAYILFGLAGVAAAGAILPSGTLQHTFNSDNSLAPLLMSVMAIPIYATPMLAMSQLGMMFQHANSIGAAFVLLVLGAGMNLGLAAWMFRQYGLKKSLVWFALLMAVVLALAYGVEKPLFPKDVEPANHTHAFDIYCQPFSNSETGFWRLAEATKEKLNRDIQIYEWHSLKLLMLLTCVGLIVRFADRTGKLTAWIETPPVAAETQKMDFILPPSIIGLCCLAGLIVLSVVGCYAYYPPADECLEEMYIVRGEALSSARSGDLAQTEYWVDLYADWSRKMEVGVYLRQWHLSDYHRWKARILREQLELLKHEVEDQEQEEVRQLILRVSKTHQRLRQAFTEELEG